jgi:dihydroxy-acid dehydratase
MLSTTSAIYGQGMGEKVALITDGRFSFGAGKEWQQVRHRRDQGHHRSSGSGRRVDSQGGVNPRRTDYNAGAIWKYAQLMGPAHLRAATLPGTAAETHATQISDVRIRLLQ